jgi:GT2 family glycosyltransferase
MSNSEQKLRLAVLMTCYNRVKNTIECLTTIKKQKPFAASVELFLVDDGSSDGTALAVAEVFPQATVILGDGNLYWCGGMRVAFAQAIERDYDFYLWLNDDTCLDDDALFRLFQTYNYASSQLGASLIIVGSTCERESGAMTYGGWRQRVGKLGSISWEKIQPLMNQWTTCDTMNGNCVLISRNVVKKIGNLDINFTHSMGDLDYGLRAKQAGCQIVIAPGYYGVCSDNDGSGLWNDERLPLLLRWRKLLGPKGSPIKEWLVFSRRHKGPLWMLVWISPYLMFWINTLLRLLGIKKR